MTQAFGSALLRRLAASRSGVAATEFAIVLPFLLGVGADGPRGRQPARSCRCRSASSPRRSPTTPRASATPRPCRTARSTKATSTTCSAARSCRAAERIGLFENGRVIISSLEVVPDSDDQQYIHWQRCLGLKNHVSTYGVEGDGLDGDLAGMGPAGEEVSAFADEAVIFVEIAYDYQSIVGETFGFSDEVDVDRLVHRARRSRPDADLSARRRRPGSGGRLRHLRRRGQPRQLGGRSAVSRGSRPS